MGIWNASTFNERVWGSLIEFDPIQVLWVRSGPIRSRFCQSDPIRSVPVRSGFCQRPQSNLNVVCRVVLHRRREGLPTKRRTAGWHVHHTSLRFRSRIAITLWSKGCYFERGTSLIWNKLLHNTGAFGRESEVMCCSSKVYDVFPYPVPNPPASTSKNREWFLFAWRLVPRLLPASSLGCILLPSNAINSC